MKHSDILQFQLIYSKTKWIIILLLLILSNVNGLFINGKEYKYFYEATVSSGVYVPSKVASTWGFRGTLIVQQREDATYMQLQSLQLFTSNGPLDTQEYLYSNINDDVKVLIQPFNVTYNMGFVQGFSTENEPVWSTNIKRSIAGIFQLDSNILSGPVSFNSSEINHYGQCRIDYVVTSDETNKRLVRKSMDPRNCVGHPSFMFSNIPSMKCHNDQNPVLKTSDRLYSVSVSENNETTITFVNATGGLYVQPFQSMGEMQYLFSRQEFSLIALNDIKQEIKMQNVEHKSILHELPTYDLTQGRSTSSKNAIFKSVGKLLDRLSQRLENPGLDTEISNIHNTTISILLYYLNMLNRNDLEMVYKNTSGTSYKEETIRNIFLETLPQVGSNESVIFVLDLIMQKKVTDVTAIKLLMYLPFHIRKPDVHLLGHLRQLMALPTNYGPEVLSTAILTFSTMIFKTCEDYCPSEILDLYVNIYFVQYTESDTYEKKMVWLQGLANIQLGKVVEFLEPIARGVSGENRHLRALAAWASLPSAKSRPEVISRAYWPILVNRTEHLENRITSLLVLMTSNPSPSRIISLYWYMQSEPCLHLYNFFYTTIKSLERSNHPCYMEISGLAAQFSRMLRKPNVVPHILTGNYIFDYQDAYRHFGTMIHGTVIANQITNVPEIVFAKLNNHANGKELNNVSLYIKAEGLLHAVTTYVEYPSRIEDILKQFKINYKSANPVHVDIIANVQGKTVLCLHLNHTNLVSAFKYVASLGDNIYHTYNNMEFHVNEQRIHTPITMESLQMTDLGTNVRFAVTVTSMFSVRGNFTHIPNGRKNHVIFRTSIHAKETIENYNPLIDLWHGAERVQSIHGYLPFNFTFGFQEKLYFSYYTPGDNLATGLIAHSRTATNIRGASVDLKLKYNCPKCVTMYTVKEHPNNEMRTETLFTLRAPELGGQLTGSLFDCENKRFRDITADILHSHRSNRQISPIIQFGLLGLHIFDYFTYISPSGSCGLTLLLESDRSTPSEIKFEHSKNAKLNLFSLKRTDLKTQEDLQQWNIALIYEVVGWITETIKIKATRTAPQEKIIKVCVEAESNIPWKWEYLSVIPSQPSSFKLNVAWDLAAESAKGKCKGSSVMLNLIGDISSQQIEESKKNVWPYEECRQRSKENVSLSYTDACYEVSKELSTLRKYESYIRYENLPEGLDKLTKQLQSFVDLTNFDVTLSQTDQFFLSVVFHKNSDIADIQFNRHKTTIELNSDVVDYFLVRTRLHNYMDNPILRTLVDTCLLTPNFVRTSNNVTNSLKLGEEILVLGHCQDDKPRFTITGVTSSQGTKLILDDESDRITIAPFNKGGILYNHTEQLVLTRNWDFNDLNSKKQFDISALDARLCTLVLSKLSTRIHVWSVHCYGSDRNTLSKNSFFVKRTQISQVEMHECYATFWLFSHNIPRIYTESNFLEDEKLLTCGQEIITIREKYQC